MYLKKAQHWGFRLLTLVSNKYNQMRVITNTSRLLLITQPIVKSAPRLDTHSMTFRSCFSCKRIGKYSLLHQTDVVYKMRIPLYIYTLYGIYKFQSICYCLLWEKRFYNDILCVTNLCADITSVWRIIRNLDTFVTIPKNEFLHIKIPF